MAGADDRDFKGVWIPREIWLSKELSAIEKFFLVEIDSLDNEEGCFAGNKHFSELFDVSKGRCSQIIKKLEAMGYVTIEIERSGKQISKRTVRVVHASTSQQAPAQKSKPRFKKPTVEEAAEYIAEKNLSFTAEEFIHANEAKGWVIGRNQTPMKNWKSHMQTWERNRKDATHKPTRKSSSAETMHDTLKEIAADAHEREMDCCAIQQVPGPISA